MIESVLRLLRKGRSEADGLDVFSTLLFASTFEQSLTGLDTVRLERFARDAFAFIQKKTHKRHSIDIRPTDLLQSTSQVAGAHQRHIEVGPAAAANGYDPATSRADAPAAGAPYPAAVSVIEILDDDMPFVVESVMGEMHGRGLRPLFVFHPVYKVKRYGAGRLQAVVGAGDRNWAAGDQESYMAILVETPDASAAADLIQALDGVLDDVRHAATDNDAMRARLQQAIAAYEAMPMALGASTPGMAPAEVQEAVEFLKWLLKGNFTFLGIRDYEFVGTEDASDLWPVTNSSLGILKTPELLVLRRGAEKLQLTPDIRAIYAQPLPLIISKASATSRVRDRAHLDYVGIKRHAANGALLGELRVVGLFTPGAYLQPVGAVPVVRQKVRKVLAQAQFPADSHSGRTLIDILEHFPRDELFQIDMHHLQAWSMALLDLSLRPRTRVLARRDTFNRYYSVLVFVPRDLYSSATRERIGRYLADTLSGRVAAFYPYISTSPLVRTQFIIGLGSNEPRDVPDVVLEHDIAELLRTWNDHLAQAVSQRTPQLAVAYASAFSAGYAETFPIERAVADIARIERLGADRPVAIDFYRDAAAPPHLLHAAVYRYDTPIALSERVPLLENLGFRVIDERSYHVRPNFADGPRDIVLHDMVLETASGKAIDLAGQDARMEDCFLAVFHGHAENDPFNGLVVAAGLEWREAAVFRAFAAYLRQIRAPFGPRYIADTLVAHASITRDLYELFRARFDPDQLHSAAARATATSELTARIETALQAVASLEEDRILRRILNLVVAMVRTNVFAAAVGSLAPETIAFKFDSRRIEALPEPRPFREIFVSSPRVEGIHLRFAAIARGGIRWSDRPQDFRTEVLSLAKAQQVKNTVIVPSGAKGGFVPKQTRRDASRDEIQQDAIACYRIFISALLSLTDNIKAGATVKPARIVCHDGDDPYLVVAADKGTATFSDYANEIAVNRGFWLGDAFASGGSSGYDHKQIGITARGAWECVKRHFRELDHDIQTVPFRVVGVGDMSGDVFGNAMLLSPVLALVAAFDHRDIFIDPAPDLAASLTERRRLFALPRSSWQDYDASKISTGGGVFSRAAKSIPLTPQIKALSGVTADALPPNDLIQAILRSPADLLWFGGIGTFIRATSETDDQVGDRANDAIRITGDEVRARVIGEGANLGVTQRGRIEAASHGVRLNADFIDNSAGVNTSDEEVNIKIALAPALAANRLTLAQRNALLTAMRDEVAAAVLVNNQQQGLALSLAEQTSRRDIAALGRLARNLEERGLISRRLEALPTGAEFTARAEAGRGLSRPELAVLLSWAKIALDADLLASSVPEEPTFEQLLLDYFPSALRDAYPAEIRSHRLRREIITTRLTNSLINRGGPALIERVTERLNEGAARTAPDIAQALMTARTIFGLPAIWSALDELDGRIGGQLQLDLYQRVQDRLIDETANVLNEQRGRDFPAMIATYLPAAETLSRTAFDIAAPRQRAALEEQASKLMSSGVPEPLARRLTAFEIVRQTMPLTDRALGVGSTPETTARVMFGAAEYLRLQDFRNAVATLKPADEFDAQAIEGALAVLTAENSSLIDRMMQVGAGAGGHAGGQSAVTDVPQWIAANAPRLAQAKPMIDAILSQSEITVSRLTVAASKVRGASAG